NRGDLALGRRIDDVETAVIGGFAPLAADPEIGRNIGEKIVVVSHDCTFTRHSGAARCAEPGIQKLQRAALASGLAPAARPGMTRENQLFKLRFTVSTIRSGVGSTMSSRMSAAGSGICGVVMRTGGPSRS